MRKFVSLAAAMMMNAVLGRENHVTTFSSDHAATIYTRPGHLKRPEKLDPKQHDFVGKFES